MRALFIILYLFLLSYPVCAQEETSEYHLGFKNIELDLFVKFAGKIFDKNILYDEEIKQIKVFLIAPKPVLQKEIWQIFLWVIEFYGYSLKKENSNLRLVKTAKSGKFRVASPETSTNSENQYQLKFHDSELAIFIQFISHVCQKAILYRHDIKDKIFILAPQPIPEKNLWPIFLTIMKYHGYIVEELKTSSGFSLCRIWRNSSPIVYLSGDHNKVKVSANDKNYSLHDVNGIDLNVYLEFVAKVTKKIIIYKKLQDQKVALLCVHPLSTKETFELWWQTMVLYGYQLMVATLPDGMQVIQIAGQTHRQKTPCMIRLKHISAKHALAVLKQKGLWKKQFTIHLGDNFIFANKFDGLSKVAEVLKSIDQPQTKDN